MFFFLYHRQSKSIEKPAHRPSLHSDRFWSQTPTNQFLQADYFSTLKFAYSEQHVQRQIEKLHFEKERDTSDGRKFRDLGRRFEVRELLTGFPE